MNIINLIRNRFHPIYWLLGFRLFRLIFKFKIIYLKKTKKFGKSFIYLPRSLNLLININQYEKETFDFINKINPKINLENSSFVDIGGNIGLYSLYFKNKYNSKIYIFEPDKDNATLLRKTKKINKFSNFIIYQKALSNKKIKKNFLIDDISGSTGTLSLDRNYPQIRMKLNKKIDVLCDRFDSFMGTIKKISWIKIDVEGHELQVVEGMTKLIKRDQPNLIIENNNRNIRKISEILRPFNYKKKKIKTDANYIFYK